jgi:hypothetical protein
VTAAYICFCGHPKSQHKRERDGCRAVDCGCAKFEVDLKASAEAQGVELMRVEAAVLPVLEAEAAKSRRILGIPAAEAQAERLAKAEQEREELRIRLTNEHQGTLALLDRRNVELRLERDAQVKLRQGLLAAEAELAEAYGLVEKIPGRKPVDVLREVIAAGQDAGVELAAVLADREATQRERNEARAEAARLRGQLTDVRAAAAEKVRAVLEADRSFADPAAGVLVGAEEAFVCLNPDACGLTFTPTDEPIAAGSPHPCGPLTPVLITVTYRTEGAPPA